MTVSGISSSTPASAGTKVVRGADISTEEARAARDRVSQQINAAVAAGSSKKQLEALLGGFGEPVYSEEELVDDENRINSEEALKAQLRAGIADPAEEFRAKALLVMPWPWTEEEKLKGAQSALEHGVLDDVVESRLSQQRSRTRREMLESLVTIDDLRRQAASGTQTWAPKHDIWKPSPYGFGYVIAVSEEELIRRGILLKPTPVADIVATIQEKAAAGDTAAQELTDGDVAAVSSAFENHDPKVEITRMIQQYLASLNEMQVDAEASKLTKLIQGGADTVEIEQEDGSRFTVPVGDFLHWLQQRAQKLADDGTYSPAMFIG